MKIKIEQKADGTVDVLLVDGRHNIERIGETKFEELLDDYHKLMKPIRDRRAREREKERKLEDERKRVAAQRVIDVDGVAIRVQAHTSADHDVRAWRDGYDPQDEGTLWVVQFDGLMSTRPYTIEGPIFMRRYDNHGLRRKVVSGRQPMRFGSIKAAVKRALELDAASEFEHPGKIERKKPYA